MLNIYNVCDYSRTFFTKWNTTSISLFLALHLVKSICYNLALIYQNCRETTCPYLIGYLLKTCNHACMHIVNMSASPVQEVNMNRFQFFYFIWQRTDPLHILECRMLKKLYLWPLVLQIVTKSLTFLLEILWKKKLSPKVVFVGRAISLATKSTLSELI